MVASSTARATGSPGWLEAAVSSGSNGYDEEIEFVHPNRSAPLRAAPCVRARRVADTLNATSASDLCNSLFFSFPKFRRERA
jgi:hypothetical protein